MKIFRTLVRMSVATVLVAAAVVIYWLLRPLPLVGASVEVSIGPGTPPLKVAQSWVAAGVQADPWLLYQWFRLSGQARQIRAGSYQISRGITPLQLLRKMVRGEEAMVMLRLLEGSTFREVRDALAKADGLRQTLNGMTDQQVMASIGAPDQHPEGRFFPDTYAYSKGVSDLALLKRAYQMMQEQLQAAWKRRAPSHPLKSPEEVLILASIVEKETGRPEDRGMVAGVFVNRLRIGMVLQTDPTVIYGLGSAFDGDLRKRDLRRDTPYNTYTRSGLPPTPIAMPSKASLMATVEPAPTDALYFVSRGDGTSEFSSTLAAHNKAVDKYQRKK